MVYFASTFVAAAAVVGAAALPASQHAERSLGRLAKRQTTENSQGTSGGFFYQFCGLEMRRTDKTTT
jgi:hypothetical protein